MYRFLFRPKWILFHLVVLAAAIGMLFLARWQWNRHLQRDAFVTNVEAREKAEPTQLAPLLTTTAPAEIEFRRVTASGRYLPADQFVEILQTQDGINGVNVITAFQITDGPVVMVNRGFVPGGQPIPAAPTDELLIGGLARRTEVRQTGQLTDNNDGANNEIRRIDLPLLSSRLGIDLAPIYIDFIASQPATTPPPTPVPPPDLSGGPPHVSYTVQWIIFSIAVVVGWVFAIRRSLRTRRRAAAGNEAPSDATTHGIGGDNIAAGAANHAPANGNEVSDERPVQPSV